MGPVPKIGLSSMADMTQFAPLAVIGSYVRSVDLLSPLSSRVIFTQHTHTERPVAALLDLWVSILAGCRSVRQINTRIRPDLPLAQSWGQEQFADQSTIARVLDVLQQEQVNQARAGVTRLFHWFSRTARHDWRERLMVDIDLTPLPAGRKAIGSRKGYFSKKGGAAANSAVSVPPTTMRLSVLGSTPATPRVSMYSRRASVIWKRH